MEVRDSTGQSILWRSKKQRGLFETSIFEFHSQAPDGPVVAAAKFRKSARSFSYHLGDLDGTGSNAWSEVVRARSRSGRAYEFALPDRRTMTWKRVHDSDRGDSKTGDRAFELVNADGEVLAVHIRTRERLKGKLTEFGRLQWFVQMAERDELAVVVVLLTVFEDMRKDESTANILPGGAAVAGAGA